MKRRSEREIIDSWSREYNGPVVSVICATYNHSDYIAQALDSILKQETIYPFEILIHDDASTDGTDDIIREYVKLYPNIIKPIYQKENQFSQGKRVNIAYNFPRVLGEYVAFCDGDDYWLSHNKLQVQVHCMRTHPDISISFHDVNVSDVESKKTIEANDNELTERLVGVSEVIEKGGAVIPSSSRMIKASKLDKILEYFNYSDCAPMGDFYIQVIAAIPNGALFVPKLRAIYRKNVPGGWSKRRKANDLNVWARNIVSAHMLLDEFTNHEFSISIKNLLHRTYYRIVRNPSINFEVRKEVRQMLKNDLLFYDDMKWHLFYRYKIAVAMRSKFAAKINYLLKK